MRCANTNSIEIRKHELRYYARPHPRTAGEFLEKRVPSQRLRARITREYSYYVRIPFFLLENAKNHVPKQREAFESAFEMWIDNFVRLICLFAMQRPTDHPAALHNSNVLNAEFAVQRVFPFDK